MPDSDVLYTLAEIAIGLAGFSAIVVLFKRRDSGRWLASDADRFNGMVLHAMVAAVFCVLPAIVGVFVAEPATIWTIASAALGVQVLFHTLLVHRLAATGPAARFTVLAGGIAVTLLQAANALGIGFSREFGPFLVGVLWHLFHAGGLFVALIWVPRGSTERA